MLTILAKYVLDCLEFCGFAINIDVNLNTQKPIYFDIVFGVICNNCSENGVELNMADAETLMQLLSGSMDELNATIKTSKNLLKLLVTFFEIKIDDELKVLHKFI